MRAGVEIVIGNMCLRQTKQKKVRLMKVVPRACACVRARVFLSLMSQRETPTPPTKKKTTGSFQQSCKYSLIGFLFTRYTLLLMVEV